MSARLGKHISRKTTSQRERIPGQKQVKNSAGGYVYEIDKWARLHRFLILGSDGGTYYVNEKKLTQDNAGVVEACVAEDFKRTVDTIVQVSDEGRAPKNDPAILALAICASTEKAEARAYALSQLEKVCRIPTHLFHFLAFVQELRGWGRALRKAVARWYEGKTADQLARDVVKYQQRDGWSHKDAMRLSHPELTADAQPVARWAIGADLAPREVKRRTLKGEVLASYTGAGTLPVIIQAFEEAKQAPKERVVSLIREHGMTWEMVPSERLSDPEVWAALLEKMPLTAMIRNLGKMTAIGLLKGLSDETKHVREVLANEQALRKARVHPMVVLNALRTYARGHGEKGKLSWTPVQAIVDALDGAFYKSFGNVQPTGKKLMLALDVSGSMGSPIAGMSLTCREAAAAMALVTANVEPEHLIVGFTSGTGRSQYGRMYGVGISELEISPKQRIDTVVRYLGNLAFGGTDCALPMVHAASKGLDVDAFSIYTDNETWAGNIHPSQALREYRTVKGTEDVKCVVVGMTATKFSIADPKDLRMLDVVGFDTATPNVISEFVSA